jgi:acetyltransferase-like isoleucine patch superfamily enzyme
MSLKKLFHHHSIKNLLLILNFTIALRARIMRWQGIITMLVAVYPRNNIFFQTINSKVNAYKRSNRSVSMFEIAQRICIGAMRMIAAKYYMRSCELGKFVSVNGKPAIENNGKIILADHVRVWSNIIQAKLFVGKKAQLIVGANSRLNGVHISARHSVIIGNNVRIAPYTIILDSDFHDVNDHFAEGKSGDIVIEDNVWIATRSTILKGVTIGKGSVVAAGSVVTRNVPPGTIVAGVPAKVIKQLNSAIIGSIAIAHQAFHEKFQDLVEIISQETTIAEAVSML